MLKAKKGISQPTTNRRNQGNSVLAQTTAGRQITTVPTFGDLPTTAAEMAVQTRTHARQVPNTPTPRGSGNTGNTTVISTLLDTTTVFERPGESSTEPVSVNIPHSTDTSVEPPVFDAFRIVGNVLQALDGNFRRPASADLAPVARATSSRRPPDVRTFWDVLNNTAGVLDSPFEIRPQETTAGTSTAVARRLPDRRVLPGPRGASAPPTTSDEARRRDSRRSPAANTTFELNVLMHDLFASNPTGVFNIAVGGNSRGMHLSARDNNGVNGIITRFREQDAARRRERPEPVLSSFKLNDSEGKSAWEAASKQECQICLCNFNLEEDVCFLPCAHLFHANCIRQWLKRQSTCPVCRTNSNE